MTTKKPRLTITLEPDHHDLLQQLSETQGVTISRLLHELIETAAEPMRSVIRITKLAQDARPEALRAMSAHLAAAEAVARSSIASAVFVGDVAALSASERAGRQQHPRPSNTGVTPPKPLSKLTRKQRIPRAGRAV